MMTFWDYVKRWLRRYIYIYDQVDTVDAAERIKAGIWFRGPNVWILAFSIIIASVGLNVNSTAVVIGAMLISPLMGPIIGMGLALGTNDIELLKAAAKNLLVMVLISLAASALFFLLSPLSLVNPTELEARTTPTIYDVLIALFGGLAGILESSRKERGTVLSGVAIATALMPPLCTAGYGLAHLNMHYFLGALYLFVINSFFIAIATYLMVKYLRFRTTDDVSPALVQRSRRIISVVLVAILVPSIWSAVTLIRDNNFERNVQGFMRAERLVDPGTYVYDYRVDGRHVSISLAGEPLTDSLRNAFYDRAGKYLITRDAITLNEHSVGMSKHEISDILREAFSHAGEEIEENEALVSAMQARLDLLERELNTLRDRMEPEGEPEAGK
ncbi:MAG: DUF389 domain-containing protein [Bacteroidales bacterium]|nr:DUF389 domain-containing protein [Bacteroidales bacterium]